jgi:serine/threonine protein kinase
VVHRDVSPRNVLVSWDGAVKVSDFGIAKARDATISTTIRGKPGYMSPEQARGARVDGRSDLFAVGVMLWELLAGIPLFPGSTHEAIAQLLFRKIPRPSQIRAGVAADIEAIAMRLLERDPDERYASADAVVEALACTAVAPRNGRGELVRWLATTFRGAVDTGAATNPVRPRARKSRTHVAVGAAIAIAIGIGAGVVIELVTREPVTPVVRTSSEPPPPSELAPVISTVEPAALPIQPAPVTARSPRRRVVAIQRDVVVTPVDAGVPDAPLPDAAPVSSSRPFDPDEVGGD